MHTLNHSDIESKLARTSNLSMSSYGNKRRKRHSDINKRTPKTPYMWFAQIFGLLPPNILLHIIFIAKGYNPQLPYHHTLCFVLLLNSLAESTSKLYIPTLGISSSILPFKMFKTKKYNSYA